MCKEHAAEAHYLHALFWMLARFPNLREVRSIEEEVFGTSFENFFGFKLPLDGELATTKFNDFLEERAAAKGSEGQADRQETERPHIPENEISKSDAVPLPAPGKDDERTSRKVDLAIAETVELRRKRTLPQISLSLLSVCILGLVSFFYFPDGKILGSGLIKLAPQPDRSEFNHCHEVG